MGPHKCLFVISLFILSPLAIGIAFAEISTEEKSETETESESRNPADSLTLTLDAQSKINVNTDSSTGQNSEINIVDGPDSDRSDDSVSNPDTPGDDNDNGNLNSLTSSADSDTKAEAKAGLNESETKMTMEQQAFEKYKRLFKEHRAMQLDAVQSITKFGNEKQRYELVNVMLKQLFTTLGEAKQNLTLWGFLPGDSFPHNDTIRDAISKVLENTAMFGDMVLHLPDVVHDLYDRDREWQVLLAWAYGFSLQSGVFEGPSGELLSLTGKVQ